MLNREKLPVARERAVAMPATFVAAAEAPTPLGDRVLRARESGIFLFTVYLVLFLYWHTGETFWTPQNLLNVARNVSFVAMMTVLE
jgi:ABC-type xylose transport system permease subunit